MSTEPERVEIRHFHELQVYAERLKRDRDALLAAAKAAVADAEKAVNPSARLFGYGAFCQAIKEAEEQKP